MRCKSDTIVFIIEIWQVLLVRIWTTGWLIAVIDGIKRMSA